MTRSSFLRGAVFGSFVTLVLGAMAFVAVIVRSSSDQPDPTASRHEVAGTVTEIGVRVCVEGPLDAEDSRSTPRTWCGIPDGRVDADIAVGDAVEGTIIDVEVDPGSGAAWSLWESLTEVAA